MEFSVSYQSFLGCMGSVMGAVLKNAPTEYLSDVKITASSTGLLLETTNMETSISSSCIASVKSPGSFCVDAGSLFDIIRKLRSDVDVDVRLDAKESGALQVVIKSSKSKFALAAKDSKNYPANLTEGFDESVKISKESLVFLLDKTKFCIFSNETRYNINGLLLHVKEGDEKTLSAVSTDGHRLALASVTLADSLKPMKITVPRKTVLEISKLISSSKSEFITFSVTQNKARFEFDNTKLVTKLIDADFPAYERVIPQGNDKTITIEAKEFVKIIDRVSAIYSSSNDIGIKINFTPDSATISAVKSSTSGDANTSTDELDCKFSGSEPITLSCNFTYLREVLSNINNKNTKIEIKDGITPIIARDEITEEEPETNGKSYFYIVMPMRA